jgi:hypothetical protein
MKVTEVTQFETGERLKMQAVGRSSSSPYPADGSDEDNTYAKWTPSGSTELTISNPALFGAFKPGEAYYIDIIKVEEKLPTAEG